MDFQCQCVKQNTKENVGHEPIQEQGVFSIYEKIPDILVGM